jgi:hypothetical protein
MVDRQQLEALLANRFPGTTQEQIAAAANAIMAMVTAVGKPSPAAGSPRKPGGLSTASSLPLKVK